MSTSSRSQLDQDLIEMERVALTRWCDGDPSGFLEISAADVVYFDPFLDRRMDGLPALAAYYESLRGKIKASRFELLNPFVQQIGDAAVLTYNFVCTLAGNREARWNCTEVFRKQAEGWRLVQSHWSITRAAGTPSSCGG